MKIIRNHRKVVESFLCDMLKIDEYDDNDRYSYYTAKLYGIKKNIVELHEDNEDVIDI